VLLDETCWLLAADFDKKTWREDSLAFLATCHRAGIPAYLERSRSGNGGHVWIFFESPVAAVLVRKMGCALLTRTMERRHHLGLDSYDRIFPNQDTLPKGGFGNLIALPLQWMPRQNGNSMFVDDDLRPYPMRQRRRLNDFKSVRLEVDQCVSLGVDQHQIGPDRLRLVIDRDLAINQRDRRFENSEPG
jgi:hypothetical protein